MIGRLSRYRKPIFASVALLLFALGLIGVISWRNQSRLRQRPNDEVLCLASGSSALGCDIQLEYAATESSREQGLSGRDGLEAGKGMLFLFESSGNQCMWMKDMKFSLDIIWLDGQKRLTTIERNLSPSSYPNNYCHLGQYVLEVSAGEINRLGLAVGQQVTFPD